MAVFEALTPTVALRVYVPISMPRGAADAWTWAALPAGDPAGYDYATSVSELIAVLRVWAAAVARVLIGVVHDRFAVVAVALSTGAAAGRHQWQRSAETGLLRPSGDPWVPEPRLLLCDTHRGTQRVRETRS